MTQRSGAIGLPDGSVQWRLWAPKARSVDLVLISGLKRRSIKMAAGERGYFTHTEPAISEAQRYTFKLDDGPDRPDPASLCQPNGVHQPSAVLRPELFRWLETAWSGVPREDLVFYELHVGTFTPEGTFDAVIPRLAALKELGITAVELMPVGQFPGSRNWGYDGVHLYAPQNTYGGPHGLQRLINACHAHGLAVFLDVVYNHLGPEGNYLNEFGPYFSDRYRTPWGSAVNFDAAGSDAVRDFILDNVRLWIGDYRFDGLRLDAVHAIFDMSACHILRDIKQAANEAAQSLIQRGVRPANFVPCIIAESNLNDVRLLQPPERGGYGLDAQWHDDFHHAVHAHLTKEQTGYYADFGDPRHFRKLLTKTFVFDGEYSLYRKRRHGAPVGDLPGDRFVVSIQNHDQVGNRANGDRLSTLVPEAAQRWAASFMLLSPHLPLLFMGEEYGEDRRFAFFCSFLDEGLAEAVRKGRREEFASFGWGVQVPDPQAQETFDACKLSWSWRDLRRAGLRRLYEDLLTLRRSRPALKDFRNRSVKLLPDEASPTILSVIRGDPSQENAQLRILFNLTSNPQILTGGTGTLVGPASPIWSSELTRYGGTRSNLDAAEIVHPFECLVAEA